MDNRSFESGAAASPPAAPASPSVGHPTAGDPQTAVPATKPGPYWFYQLGEELRAVLVAAGITPDKDTLTQLLTALRSAGVFTTPALGDRTTKAATMACFSQEFAASLAASGYQILPSGLIVQWGATAIASSGTVVTLPVAFPNVHYSTILSPSEAVGIPRAALAYSRTLSNFQVSTYSVDTGVPLDGECAWVSFGR